MSNEDPVPSFDDVMRAARRWYYSEIRDLVDDAIARLKSECKPSDEDEAREWLRDDVDQTTDGHAFVIYTGQAAMACAASDNDGAYEDDTGEAPPTVEVRACYAMRADAWELLEARSDEWIPPEPVTCGECGAEFPGDDGSANGPSRTPNASHDESCSLHPSNVVKES